MLQKPKSLLLYLSCWVWFCWGYWFILVWVLFVCFLFWVFLNLFWYGFFCDEKLTGTDKFLAFVHATLQEQSKYKEHINIVKNAMESSEKKTLKGKTCLEEWWQCSNHNLLKPEGIVNFSSFIFCWNEQFTVLSTSWHEEDKGHLKSLLLRTFESSFLRYEC